MTNLIVLSLTGLVRPVYVEALAGFILAHTAHLLSVIVLHSLSSKVFSATLDGQVLPTAFISACLHVFSPAGIFLSAPYGESLFSFLQFLGFYCYADSMRKHAENRSLGRDVSALASGISLGLATTVRSNGILSGAIFAYDVIVDAVAFVTQDRQLSRARKIAVELIGGCAIVFGAAFPQLLAYLEFCTDQSHPSDLRPWCKNSIPSIYTWVQSHYW